MPRTDAASRAKRLYERFLAPLVLGGELSPGPALGAEAALSLDGGLATVDGDLRSQVDVARVRVARRLVPVDVVAGPDAHEWALGAALHDLVHALHPDLQGPLHSRVPDRLFDLCEQVWGRVPPPGSLAEAVSRHAFFARVFEIERTDTVVSWWTGSKRFLGRAPPPRLLAWPALRRVHTDEATLPLSEIADVLDARRRARFHYGLARLLEKTPLTDLATCTRVAPRFEWTGATLGLFATPHSRALALRALGLGPAAEVDAALGRATRPHAAAGATENLRRIGDVLAERALAVALSDLPPSPQDRSATGDAHYARVLGAALALARVDLLGASPARARRVTGRLMPLAQSRLGRELATAIEAWGPPAAPVGVGAVVT